MRVAWILPGQGSLRTGCLDQATATDGRDELTAIATAAGRALDRVERATGRDVRALAADADTGARTADAQPTILAASLAAAAALEAAGLRPDVVAGHSLGECTAAIIAGCLDLEAGARVVAARGAAMAAACAENPGAMAAVVKLAPEAVAAVVDAHPDVVVANDNAPGQVVVAGPPGSLAALRDPVRAAGGRLVRLEVEGAFHSAAMSPAVPALADALGGVPIADPNVPFVSGVGARRLSTGSAVADALLGGVLATVRWREVQLALAADGVTHLVEVGPGGVLAGLAKRTVPDLQIRTVAGPADAHALAVELGTVVGAH